MRRETERWLRHALDDAETARVTLEGRRWAATSLHAQQAVEKALKALWVERKDNEPPRTHDLVRLGDEFDVPREWLGEFAVMTEAYLVSRYPDADVETDAGSRIEPDLAGRHLTLANEVIAWVQERLTAS
jgi:HEPN domain-containing protein